MKNLLAEFWGISMKLKLTLLTIFATLILLAFSSCATLPEAYVHSNYKNNLFLEDLIEYIKADESLDQRHKDIRIRAIETAIETNKMMYNHVKGEK